MSHPKLSSKLYWRTTVGMSLTSDSPMFASAVGAAGYDWVVLDTTTLASDQMLQMLQAVGDSSSELTPGGTPVLVRVAGPRDGSGIQRAADAGAAGVLVPNVRTVKDVMVQDQEQEPFVARAMYPPLGSRSLVAPVRAHYRQNMILHTLQANSSMVICADLSKVAANKSLSETLKSHDPTYTFTDEEVLEEVRLLREKERAHDDLRGFKWARMTKTKPGYGIELENQKLAQTLEYKKEFTDHERQQLEIMEVVDGKLVNKVRKGHYIKCTTGFYFEPVEAKLNPRDHKLKQDLEACGLYDISLEQALSKSHWKKEVSDIIERGAFHVAVLDIPTLCMTMGVYDFLLNPGLDARSLKSEKPPSVRDRLQPFAESYRYPTGYFRERLEHFVRECRKYGKVPGALLGEQAACEVFKELGFNFIGLGNDMVAFADRVFDAVQKQEKSPLHSWKPRPLDVEAIAKRAGPFGSLRQKLGTHAHNLSQPIHDCYSLCDTTYEEAKKHRDDNLVLIDAIKYFRTPTELQAALLALDGNAHRLVRVMGCDATSSPITPAMALALGADSILCAVESGSEAQELAQACAFKEGDRYIRIGPDLPRQLARKPVVIAELTRNTIETDDDFVKDIAGRVDAVAVSLSTLAGPVAERKPYSNHPLLQRSSVEVVRELKRIGELCREAYKPLVLLDDLDFIRDHHHHNRKHEDNEDTAAAATTGGILSTDGLKWAKVDKKDISAGKEPTDFEEAEIKNGSDLAKLLLKKITKIEKKDKKEGGGGDTQNEEESFRTHSPHDIQLTQDEFDKLGITSVHIDNYVVFRPKANKKKEPSGLKWQKHEGEKKPNKGKGNELDGGSAELKPLADLLQLKYAKSLGTKWAQTPKKLFEKDPMVNREIEPDKELDPEKEVICNKLAAALAIQQKDHAIKPADFDTFTLKDIDGNVTRLDENSFIRVGDEEDPKFFVPLVKGKGDGPKEIELRKFEWDRFKDKEKMPEGGLTFKHFIKVGDSYFLPAEEEDYDPEKFVYFKPVAVKTDHGTFGHADEAEDDEASGLKWIKLAKQKEKPAGEELEAESLAISLQDRAGKNKAEVEFTEAEWDKFGILDLRMSHIIKAGDVYFRPAESLDPEEAAEAAEVESRQSVTQRQKTRGLRSLTRRKAKGPPKAKKEKRLKINKEDLRECFAMIIHRSSPPSAELKALSAASLGFSQMDTSATRYSLASLRESRTTSTALILADGPQSSSTAIVPAGTPQPSPTPASSSRKPTHRAKQQDPAEVEATGLKWRKVGKLKDKPAGELDETLETTKSLVALLANENKELMKMRAAQNKPEVELTEDEWIQLGIKDLRMNHFVKVRDLYFQPAESVEEEQRDDVLDAANERLDELKLAILGLGDPKDSTLRLGMVCACGVSSCLALADMGLDWIWLDAPHGSMDAATLKTCADTLRSRGVFSVVRVEGPKDRVNIQAAYDAGVDICIVPHVSTKDEAVQAIQSAVLPWETVGGRNGTRVWDGTHRSCNRKMLMAVQLQTQKGLEELDAISSLDEIEMLLMSPGDVAMSLGLVTRDSLFGFMAAPELTACMTEVATKCNDTAKIPAGFTRGGNPSTLIKHGFKFVSIGADNWDITSAMDVYLHGSSGPDGPLSSAKAGWQPGVCKAIGWSRNHSVMIPSPAVLLCQIMPAVLAHLIGVQTNKFRASQLKLPERLAQQNLSAVYDAERTFEEKMQDAEPQLDLLPDADPWNARIDPPAL